MKKNKIFLCLAGLTFLASCSSHDHWPKKEKIKYKVTVEAAKKIAKDNPVKMIGWGGSGKHAINYMDLSLNCFKHLNMEDARELIVYSINTYLNEINNDKEIRPYLGSWPLKNDSIGVDIYVDSHFEDKEPYNIDVVGWNGRNINYNITNKKGRLEMIHEETYEEAVKILEQQKNQK